MYVREGCDRCIQRATSRVYVARDLSLYFCSHHYAEHEAAVEGRGYIVEVVAV